ncbi:MAG: glycosyltransferase family 39 protein [Candidatus Shapirobacteria bacterium]
MKKKEIKTFFFLAGLISIAAFLRFYELAKVPIELFGDELDIGYQAYSLFKTGGDYFGNKWPVFFRSFAEYRMPMLVYLTAPLVGFFGLNNWAVRVIPALFGCIDIILVWIFLKQLTKNKTIVWTGAIFMSFIPWHTHYSRTGFDTTILLAFVFLSLIFFFRGLREKKFLLLSALIWPLTFYTYSTSLVFSLLFLPLIFWLYRLEISKAGRKTLALSGVIFLVVCLPLIANLVNGRAGDRFSQISLLNDSQMVDELYQKRAQERGGGRIFHNKAIYLGKEFITNYLQAFSPEFLFINGDPNPRHSVNDFGMLFFVFAPLIILGFYSACAEKEANLKRANYLFLGWLLTAPIASALTIDGGSHATRLFLMLPAWVYFASLGARQFLSFKDKLLVKGTLVLLITVFIGEGILYFHQYFFHYPRESWEYFDFGYQEALTYLKEHESDYDQVFIDSAKGPPLLQTLYWLKIDPGFLKNNYQGQDWQVDIFPGFDGFKMGKYYFGEVQNPLALNQFLSPGMIYLAFQNTAVVPGDWNWERSSPDGVRVLKMVKRPFADIPLIYLLTGEEN